MKILSNLADAVNGGVVGGTRGGRSLFKNSSTRSREEATGGNGVEAESRQDDGSSSSSSSSSSSMHRSLDLGSFDFESGGGNSRLYPCLYREACDMVDMSNLIYVLAEVREMARSGALDDDGTGALSSMVLDLPSSLDDLAGALLGGGRGGGDVLGAKLDDGKHAAVMGALGGLLRRREETRAALSSSYDGGGGGGGFGWMMACCGAANIGGSTTGGVMVGPSIITDMGDARSNEELVYAVGVNPLMERITIIFRGSVTKSDFVTDSRIAFVRAPHPNKLNGLVAMDRYGGCDDVGLHQGFYEYLLGEKDGRSSKYDEISNIVRRLLREDPARANYKLYVTGHSLGGALATLFGYYASMSPHLPSPITVVSVASPRVGNIEFARSFVELESHGRIRHLRIANHGDPVTLNPTISARRALALSAKAVSPLGYLALLVTGNGEGGEEQVYYHTGIKLKLLRKACPESNRRCEITYSGASILAGAKKPADTDMDAEDFADMEQAKKMKKSLSKSSELPMVSYHYGDAYSERMALLESDLEGLTLNDMYHSKARGSP